jgi:hypothetical protein
MATTKISEARSLPSRASREFPLVMYRKGEPKLIADAAEEEKEAKAGFSRTPPAPEVEEPEAEEAEAGVAVAAKSKKAK